MYYVYYDETGYGDFVLEKFNSEEEAMKHINENLSNSTLNEFKLINGHEIKLKAIEVTTKVVKA